MANKAPKKKAPRVKSPLRKKAVRKAPARAKIDLDLDALATESIASGTLGLCLACALDALTRHVRLSQDRAISEIRKYSPALEELSAASPSRP